MPDDDWLKIPPRKSPSQLERESESERRKEAQRQRETQQEQREQGADE